MVQQLHSSQSFWGQPSATAAVVAFAASVGCLAGCAPNLTTQPRRLDFLREHVDQNLASTFGCEDVVLRFEHTEQRSGHWYDYYLAEGCGRKSDYVTQLSLTNAGKFATWAFAASPPEAQLVTAAQDQLLKTARFDLSCDDVALTALKEAIDPMHTGYRATLGARGCDKQASYEVMCGSAGYVNGKHDVNCQSIVSASR